jgi:hypothetical protein
MLTRLITVLFVIVFMMALVWLGQLTSVERWFFLNFNVANDHAKSLLLGNAIKTPEALIDATISASDGVVFVSFHEDSEEVLIYSPDRKKLDELRTKASVDGLRGDWFAVKPR